MKRQIIFRGKCVETNKWVYGDLQQDYDGSNYISYWISELIEPENNYHEPKLIISKVLPDSVGQYTGLNARNNVMIFEGDIVGKGRGLIYYDENRGVFKVKWYDNIFKRVRGNSPNYQNGETLFMNSEIAWEVIGNSTDNNDLLV